jgi:toxin ParE1/3/4
MTLVKLVIRDEAADDLEGIYDWIAKDNMSAASRVVRALRKRMDDILLPELVNSGRPGRAHGTRELIEPPYIIVYEVDEDKWTVTIIAVTHGALIAKER